MFNTFVESHLNTSCTVIKLVSWQEAACQVVYLFEN